MVTAFWVFRLFNFPAAGLRQRRTRHGRRPDGEGEGRAVGGGKKKYFQVG